MIRRFGEPPEAHRRYQRRPGVYALLEHQGALLLTVQTAPKPDLQLPGGGVDPGEQPVAALHREVMEETGWIIAAPRRMGMFRQFVFMPEYDLWAEKLCTIYRARPVRRAGPPTEKDHAPLWLPLRDAATMLGSEAGQYFAGRLAVSI